MLTAINTGKLKARLLILPFFYIYVLFTTIYTFLNWLLIIKLEMLQLDEILVNFIIPIAIIAVLLLIWLSTRIAILNPERKGKDKEIGFFALALVFIAVPCIITQYYIPIKTGKLCKLTKISEIGNLTKSKYYSVSKYYIDKKDNVDFGLITTSGKNNKDLNFFVHIASPIVDDSTLTNCIASQSNGDSSLMIKATFNTWIDKEFSLQTTSYISKAEKDTIYDTLRENSLETYMKSKPESFLYMERLQKGEDYEIFKETINKQEVNYDKTKPLILLKTKKGTYEERAGSMLFWIIATFIIGSIIWPLVIYNTPFNEAKLNKHLYGSQKKGMSSKEFY